MKVVTSKKEHIARVIKLFKENMLLSALSIGWATISWPQRRKSMR
jgi:hypothetical protein